MLALLVTTVVLVVPGLVTAGASGAVLALARQGTLTISARSDASLPSVDLSAARTAFQRVSGTGASSVTWNPTLIIDEPDTGTITHSVT